MAEPEEFSPAARAIGAGVIAALCAGGAVWLGVQLGWPASFDVNDVDFVNPLSIMVLALACGSLWFAGKAAIFLIRHRAFGKVVLEIDPPGALRLGRVFAGRLRAQKPVAATGPFRLVLTCMDIHQFDEDGGFKTADFPVWTAERTLPPETDATRGLPFRFDLPTSVGMDPVPSGILPGSVNRHRATVHIPGMRKVVASNVPPVGRYWKLEAFAPTPGPDFRAEVLVPQDSQKRKGRLP
jgi:hypothetical protein